MINDNEIQITISSTTNSKQLTDVANEIYDRLRRLGYNVSCKNGRRIEFNTGDSIFAPIYIKTAIKPNIEHEW